MAIGYWTMWNISPKQNTMPEDEKLQGISEGMTNFGTSWLWGVRAQTKEHIAIFSIYTRLDTLLDLPADTTRSELWRLCTGIF